MLTDRFAEISHDVATVKAVSGEQTEQIDALRRDLIKERMRNDSDNFRISELEARIELHRKFMTLLGVLTGILGLLLFFVAAGR